MFAAIYAVIVLAAGVAGAFWLFGLTGSVQIQVQGQEYSFKFAHAVLIAAGGFLALYIALRLLGWLFVSVPRQIDASRERNARAAGEAATVRALTALAARDGAAARAEAQRARTALGATPQVLLLTAQAARMDGQAEAAEQAYRELAETKGGRFLGIQGLLREAMEVGDHNAALTLAREAEAAYPGAAWLREERTELAMRTRDWREALALAPPETPRAPLALAAAGQEPDPIKAAAFEAEAFAADRSFAPAALAHARRLRGSGNPKQAKAVLEQAWAAAPHPAIAAAYLEPVDSPMLRVREAEALTRRNRGKPESRLLVAEAAAAAGMLPRARAELEPLVASGAADQRAFQLLADLEEREGGDTAEARAAQAKWLREAGNAPAAPVWRCGNCGTQHAEWAPVCGSCDAVGQIAWTATAKAA